MCIFTKQENPIIAKTPIKCMKVVRKCINSDGSFVYLSLLMSEPAAVQYIVGKETRADTLYKGRCLDIRLSSKIISMYDYEYFSSKHYGMQYMAKFGIHSYDINSRGWKLLAAWANNYYTVQRSQVLCEKEPVEIAVLECEIPVGAEYFSGIHNCFNYYKVEDNDEKGYTSDKVKVISEIQREEWIDEEIIF